jgi:hypothetical protein
MLTQKVMNVRPISVVISEVLFLKQNIVASFVQIFITIKIKLSNDLFFVSLLLNKHLIFCIA